MMPSQDTPARVIVRHPMNDHGAMTVELCETNETRHICKYATPELKRQLASVSVDTQISLSLSRIGVRANVWQAKIVVENRSNPPTVSSR